MRAFAHTFKGSAPTADSASGGFVHQVPHLPVTPAVGRGTCASHSVWDLNSYSCVSFCHLCKRTIQKFMLKIRGSPHSSQTCATFVRNHARDIWACDFTVVYDWLFRPWCIFWVIERKTRRIVHTDVTNSPTGEWTTQPLREATPWGKGPKYLLYDSDNKYGSHFSAVASGSGIKELRTPY